MAGSSTTSVIWSITANGLVTIAKFGAFLVSGSGAMLSETLHSMADTANQTLLLVGIKRSDRGPDPRHPFGYGRERFFWGLVSALGIFFLGAGVTVYHGIHSLMHPEPAHHTWVTWAVLGGSFLLEGAVFVVAWRGLAKDARAAGVAPLAYARAGTDPTAIAVILEDGAAMLGLLLAVVGIGLEQATGSPIWDAIATLSIGVLLAVVALFLVAINRSYLITRAVDPEVARAVRQTLEAQPAVERIGRVRGVVLNLGRYSVHADVDFDGRVIADRVLARSRVMDDLEEAEDRRVRTEVLRAFAEEVLTALGDEVDAIEETMRESVPGVDHVDLEAD